MEALGEGTTQHTPKTGGSGIHSMIAQFRLCRQIGSKGQEHISYFIVGSDIYHAYDFLVFDSFHL